MLWGRGPLKPRPPVAVILQTRGAWRGLFEQTVEVHEGGLSWSAQAGSGESLSGGEGRWHLWDLTS